MNSITDYKSLYDQKSKQVIRLCDKLSEKDKEIKSLQIKNTCSNMRFKGALAQIISLQDELQQQKELINRRSKGDE